MTSSRLSGANISSEVAQQLLEEHIPAIALSQPKQLWQYGNPCHESGLWKKAIRWPEISRHRSFLEDLNEATKGRVVYDTCIRAELAAFLQGKPHAFKPKDIDAACYRARCMQAHLRNVKRLATRPPQRHARLQVLIDQMVPPASKPDEKTGTATKKKDASDEEEEEEEETDPCNDDDVVVIVPSPAKKINQEIVVDSNSEAEYVFKICASPATKLATDLPTTPPPPLPRTTSSSASSAEKATGPLVNLQELLAKAAGVAAIDPRVGNKNFGWDLAGPMKKPAAAGCMKRPAADVAGCMKRPAAAAAAAAGSASEDDTDGEASTEDSTKGEDSTTKGEASTTKGEDSTTMGKKGEASTIKGTIKGEASTTKGKKGEASTTKGDSIKKGKASTSGKGMPLYSIFHASSKRKLLYSKVYHATKWAVRKTLSPDAASAKARVAANKACDNAGL